MPTRARPMAGGGDRQGGGSFAGPRPQLYQRRLEGALADEDELAQLEAVRTAALEDLTGEALTVLRSADAADPTVPYLQSLQLGKDGLAQALATV